MRNKSPLRPEPPRNTWIAITLDHVQAWRKAMHWSRESVVGVIEAAHERIDGPARMGVRFEPKCQDTFERARINAERVFRWLDDASKDTNLLSLNFAESIVAAMPQDVALHFLNDLLRPLGFAAHAVAHDLGSVGVEHLQALIKECAEAEQAVSALLDGATRDELVRAQAELSDSVDVAKSLLATVEAALADELGVIVSDCLAKARGD